LISDEELDVCEDPIEDQNENSKEQEMEEEKNSEDESVDSFDPYANYVDEEDKIMENEERIKSEFLNKTKKDFDDEVDYKLGSNMLERFNKYIGLKNFKNAEWVR